MMSKQLEELTELARQITKSKLEEVKLKGYSIPDGFKEKLSLEIGFEGDNRIFELVVVGKKPEDAIILTSLRANLKTKKFYEIQIFLEFFDYNT